VPFAKRGVMDEWIPLMNKAVELDPEAYLGQRAWYHWFFMHNYEKAIADVDSLDALVSYDIGETGDGYYHLNIMKALCYKGLGEKETAISLIKDCMTDASYYEGLYDNIHLGVLYLETGQFDQSLVCFKKQIEYNEVAEAYFYSAKVYLHRGDKQQAIDLLELAFEKYDAGIKMHNPYRQLVDEIYMLDIEEEMELLME
jgi:tetratricopeptide (TPR) repeat protein